MKKFLTVLLALSVVFTYTVGTAFALPNDGDDQAGLPTAKAEATATLDSYLDDINDYTEVGQKLLDAEVLKGKTAVNDAKSITEVKTELEKAEKRIKALSPKYLKTAVRDAQEKALEQVEDYLYLFGVTVNDANINKGTMKINNYPESGNIKLDGLSLSAKDEDAFENAYNKEIVRLCAATSTEDVANTLNDTIELIDKYMNKLGKEEVSAEKKDALVKAILEYAQNKNVNTTTHSKTIVSKYDAMIKEAVSAAKAVNTMVEYYDVINTYLGTAFEGTDVESAVVSAGKVVNPLKEGYVVELGVNEVYVVVSSTGELNKLWKMNKDVEARIEVAKQAIALIGDYKYADIEEDNWDAAEEIHYALNEFIENGVWPTCKTAKANEVITIVNALDKTATAADKKDAAGDVADKYAELTKLFAAKTPAKTKIAGFYGYDMYGANATLTDYSDAADNNVQKQITDLQQLYTQYVDAAGTVADVDKYVAAYRAKVDTYKTVKEQTIEKNYSDIVASINKVAAELLKDVTVSPSKAQLRDRLLADLKADLKAGKQYEFVAAWDVKDVQTTKDDKVKTLLIHDGYQGTQSLEYTLMNLVDFNNAYTYGYELNKYDVVNYNPNNYNTAEMKQIEVFQAKLEEALAQTNQTWNGYFAAYDQYKAEADKVATKWELAYAKAVKDAEVAISALGAVENTYAFEAKLNTAKDAVDAAEAAKNDLAKVMSAKEVYSVAGISNIEAYLDAAYELAYLKHLASVEEDLTLPYIVRAYNDIALAITNGDILDNYDATAKQQILDIVTKAFDDIDAATTNDAKATIAKKAIEDLKAIATKSDNTNYNTWLAENKAEAVKYFEKYYNANFTTEAATATQLVKDILAFNEQFHQSVIDAKEQLIKDIKGTHMKIGSSAAKGYIRISWKQSNSTVALDGVKVYRSTKKTSGFKLISTFKKQTAKKYTANLKKGTKYYYKVKGYKVIDGVTYYTHESITVGRTFR